MTVDK